MVSHIFPSAKQAAEQFHTIRDILRWAVSMFHANKIHFGQGTENAWDEAVYLTLATLKLPVDTLEPYLDARLSLTERQHVCELIQKRIDERMPSAYLLNEAWLQGYRFYINQNCIIPRSPIAELIVESLQPWVQDPYQPKLILDLCTGSGCLAILAALYFPDARIDAVDISANALAVAKRNVNDYELQARIKLIQSDLFKQITKIKYDIILCNPPYVNTHSMQKLPKEFLHEPSLALAGGTDGMDYVRTIMNKATHFLQPNGMLILEIGHEYPHFIQAFPNLEPIWLSTATTNNQILLLYKEQLTT